MGCCQASPTKEDETAVAEMRPSSPQRSETEATKSSDNEEHKSRIRTDSMISREIDDFMGKSSATKTNKKNDEIDVELSSFSRETKNVADSEAANSSLFPAKDRKSDFDKSARKSMKRWNTSMEATSVAQVISCKGWLLKKGQGRGLMSRRNWKRRYFVLEGKHLRYYTKNGEDGNGIGIKGELAVMSSSILPIRKVDGAKYDAMFDVIQRHPIMRIIHLRGEDEDAMKMWLDSFAAL